MNGWLSCQDVSCSWVSGCAVFDTYKFELSVPDTDEDMTNQPVESVSFCICFSADGTQHWDNNQGANYQFVMFSRVEQPYHPSPEPEESQDVQLDTDASVAGLVLTLDDDSGFW